MLEACVLLKCSDYNTPACVPSVKPLLLEQEPGAFIEPLITKPIAMRDLSYMMG